MFKKAFLIFLLIFCFSTGLVAPLEVSKSEQASAQINQDKLISANVPIEEAASKEIELTENEVRWIQSHPNILVGVEHDWAPYSFVANGKEAGFNNDYLMLLGKKAGLNLHFILEYPWSELMKKIRRKEIDLLPGAAVSEERKEFLNFTGQYLTTTDALVVNLNIENVNSFSDLAGKRLAAIKGYISVNLIRDKYPEIEIVYFETVTEALMAVNEGIVDAFYDYLPVINYQRRENQFSNLHVVDIEPLFKGFPMHIGVRKDWPELHSILNKAMGAVTPNEFEDLKNNWLGTEKMQFNKVHLNPSEKDFLSSLGPIRMGVSTSWIPVNYVDANGAHKGIASEYVKIIKNKLGLVLENIAAPWQELQQKTRAGDIDFLPLLNETSTRREFLSFTKPYLHIPIIIATRMDAPYYPHVDDLTNSTVGVGEGRAVQSKLKRDYPEINTRGYANIGAAIQALGSGEVDAIVVNSAVFSYFQNELGVKTSTHINNTTHYMDELSMGVRHELASLIPLLNRALADISPDEHELIMDKWTNLPFHKEMDWSMVWKIGIIFFIVFIFIMYWNRQLVTARKQTQIAQDLLVVKNMELEHLSITDHLTGLYNRVKLDQALNDEIQRFHRYNNLVSIILLDIDFFKKINDNFGHQEGDRVLQEVAATLRDSIREVDIVGRWGGEEFLIICSETDLEGAILLAEKLRTKIEHLKIGNSINVTASFGVAEFTEGEEEVDLISKADNALYKAKENGRNRIESI